MAREWSELLRLRGEAPAPAEDGEAAVEERGGFFRRLRESLRATREALGGELGASFARTLEAQDWEALEEALITADVGAPATAAVVESLERIARDEHLAGEALRGPVVHRRLGIVDHDVDCADGRDAARVVDLGDPLRDRLEHAAIVNFLKTLAIGFLEWDLADEQQ